MTRHFSIPTMLRMTPNHLLKALFEHLETPLPSFDWERCKERQIEPILLAISWLPHEVQARVEAAFADIFELASAPGWSAILEACQLVGEHRLLQEMPEACHYARAALTWLRCRSVFTEALLLRQIEQATYWRKRTDIPRVTPRVTLDSKRDLAHALAECLQREEGRGRNCTVEYIRRRDNADVFVAYPDDFMQAMLTHDAQGLLHSERTRPTFEIVFVYRQEHGTLELSAKVGSRLKPHLESLFSQIILGEEIGPRSQKPYDLNRLKDQGFCLETDPEDRVTASITKLRLSSRWWGKIGLEPDKEQGDSGIVSMVEHCLNTENLGWDEINVQMAAILFEFEPSRGDRSGSMEFNITYPNHFSIRRGRPERIALVRKYLQRWRIAHG